MFSHQFTSITQESQFLLGRLKSAAQKTRTVYHAQNYQNGNINSSVSSVRNLFELSDDQYKSISLKKFDQKRHVHFSDKLAIVHIYHPEETAECLQSEIIKPCLVDSEEDILVPSAFDSLLPSPNNNSLRKTYRATTVVSPLNTCSAAHNMHFPTLLGSYYVGENNKTPQKDCTVDAENTNKEKGVMKSTETAAHRNLEISRGFDKTPIFASKGLKFHTFMESSDKNVALSSCGAKPKLHALRGHYSR